MSTVFRVILEGSQEVPPNDSTASGVGTVVFDDAAVAASYSFDIEGLDFGPIRRFRRVPWRSWNGSTVC